MIAICKYGLERPMCNYEEEHINYGFESTSPGSAASTISSSSRSSSSDSGGPVFIFQSMDDGDMKLPHLRKSVNKLGGMYTSGKPLPISIRREIVAMAETGMKACDISRQLQISHGCVSKIISKYRATGSFEPRRIGGSKPKKTLPEVIGAVRMYKRACPSIHSLEIRRRLLADEICTDYNVPSLSSINRIIRMKLRDEVAEFEASAVRDLMAILTGPPSSDIDCDMSPDPPEEGIKIENPSETEEFEKSPISTSSEIKTTITPMEHLVHSTAPPDVEHVEKPYNQSIDCANFLQLPIIPEFPTHFIQNTTNVRINDEKKSTRMHDIFIDPYGDCSLGTPIFNDSNNLDTNHPPPIESKFRTTDNPSMIFSFDFEENVWSWLDQVP